MEEGHLGARRGWPLAMALALVGIAGCGSPGPTTVPSPFVSGMPAAAGQQTAAPSTTGVAPPTSTASPRGVAAGRLPGEPNPSLTPGAFNPAVTQATIGTTICVAGWTATVRPPSSYTTPLKVRQIAQYGYADTRTSSYEEDHLIPLELGGAPSDPRNLWPEPYAISLSDGRSVGARVKDTYETALKTAVCAGTMTLAQARARIGDHWVHYFYGLPLTAGTAVPRTTAAPTAKPTTARPAGTLFVRFVSLPDPAVPRSTASMAAKTTPGAICSARVTWPSGSVSTAAGLKTTPKAGSDGLVSWTWNVSARTKPGTATAQVACTLGGSTSATATFPVG